MGTRGSALALAQSRQLARALEVAHPGLRVQENIIRTTGDRQQGQPLPQIGGKGVFTLEIEQALLSGEIDFAVHSLKDLPPELPDGLCLAAMPRRAPAGDVCILHPILTEYSALPENARVGTSSLRRRAQLLRAHPQWRADDIRGNIDTRLRKLEEQNFHAIVLARAGLERLGVQLPAQRLHFFDEREFVPAPGQGALALEARENDERTLKLLRALEDAATRAEATAERAIVRHLEAGCSTPLGARAIVSGDTLQLWAVVLSTDGKTRLFAQAQGAPDEADMLGGQVAEELLRQGARELLS
jgi:hydroxymethylbilane synthase